jgi:hypothetical protein
MRKPAIVPVVVDNLLKFLMSGQEGCSYSGVRHPNAGY